MFIRIVGLLAGYLFAILVSRFYGASTYGLISLSFSFFILLGMVSRLGLDTNIVKFYATDNNLNEKGLFFRSLIKALFFSCLLSVLLFVFGEVLSKRLFEKPNLTPYFFWIAVALPFWTATQIFGGFLRARKHNKWYAFLNNPGRFLFSFLILLAFYLLGSDPLNGIIAHFWANVILCLIGFGATLRVMGKVTFKTTKDSWLFLKESFPMMLSSTILVLLGWMDTIVLGIFHTDEVVGVYNVALKIATITSFSLQAINSILAPKLALSYSESNTFLFNKLITFSTKLNFFITVGFVLAIILFNKTILLVFGSEFLTGSTVLIVLALGQLVNSMSGSVGVILQMIGKQQKYQNIVLIALIINFVLNFALVPVLGGLGAAVATTISIMYWNISGAVYLKRKMQITSYYKP